MKLNVSFRLLFVLAALLPAAGSLRAQNLGAIKERIAARLDAVNGLKDRGEAGENNRGFLEARASVSGPGQQIISDENADRRTVYAALAAKTGATADTVGRQRAQQIAALAKRGHWIQEPNGEWRQKG